MACSSLLSEEDLSRFRTKQCKRLTGKVGCEFGVLRCQYSHNRYWNRRCPIYLSNPSFIRYIPCICPYVNMINSSTSASSIIISNCIRGGECPFAHSQEEIFYHPLFYKRITCKFYQQGQCKTYYCPFIHGLAETRALKTFKLPFTQNIEIPPIEGVVVVDKIECFNRRCNLSSSKNLNTSYLSCPQLSMNNERSTTCLYSSNVLLNSSSLSNVCSCSSKKLKKKKKQKEETEVKNIKMSSLFDEDNKEKIMEYLLHEVKKKNVQTNIVSDSNVSDISTLSSLSNKNDQLDTTENNSSNRSTKEKNNSPLFCSSSPSSFPITHFSFSSIMNELNDYGNLKYLNTNQNTESSEAKIIKDTDENALESLNSEISSYSDSLKVSSFRKRSEEDYSVDVEVGGCEHLGIINVSSLFNIHCCTLLSSQPEDSLSDFSNYSFLSVLLHLYSNSNSVNTSASSLCSDSLDCLQQIQINNKESSSNCSYSYIKEEAIKTINKLKIITEELNENTLSENQWILITDLARQLMSLSSCYRKVLAITKENYTKNEKNPTENSRNANIDNISLSPVLRYASTTLFDSFNLDNNIKSNISNNAYSHDAYNNNVCEKEEFFYHGISNNSADNITCSVF